MLQQLRRQAQLHDWSYYILTRGLWLTCALLLSALVLLRADDPWLARWYAGYLRDMAAVTLGGALIGSLLLEDVFRRIGA